MFAWKRLFTLPACLCIALGASDAIAVNEEDLTNEGEREKLCEADGLCWRRLGDDSLEGAYQRGGRELHFEMIHAPQLNARGESRDQWSYRLSDWNGSDLLLAPASTASLQWHPGRVTIFRGAGFFEPQDNEVKARQALAKEMMQAWKHVPSPGGFLDEPWAQFHAMLSRLFQP